MDKVWEIVILIVGVLAVMVALSFVIAVPVWFLWNWVIAGVFGAPALTYMQTWGLLALKVLILEFKSKPTKSEE